MIAVGANAREVPTRIFGAGSWSAERCHQGYHGQAHQIHSCHVVQGGMDAKESRPRDWEGEAGPGIETGQGKPLALQGRQAWSASLGR